MTMPILDFEGPHHNLRLLGVALLGVNEENGRKLGITVAFVVVLYIVGKVIAALAGGVRRKESHRIAFWTRQGTSLALFVVGLVGLVSVWFDNPARLATGLGLMGAGLAFALQKVVSSLAGYFVILRGKTFNVGDRIVMGGVRGDVVALNFMQTVIMEMGQPPPVQGSNPGMWVESRQFSGRIVTIANSKIFEEPVYNYTRDFPFIWEEMRLPIAYKDDRGKVEAMLLAAAERETPAVEELARAALDGLEKRFLVHPSETRPRVYVRLTDNWVEMTVRFLCPDHDIRGIKDRMSRALLRDLEEAGIGIASSTYDIVGLPPIHVQLDAGQTRRP
jgi:small-conductance mechanosensitive channel